VPFRVGGSAARVCVVEGAAEVTTGDLDDDATVAVAELLMAGLDVAVAGGAGWTAQPATSRRLTVASAIVIRPRADGVTLNSDTAHGLRRSLAPVPSIITLTDGLRTGRFGRRAGGAGRWRPSRARAAATAKTAGP